MAANWELQLLAAIVRGNDPSDLFESAQAQGIRFTCFGGMESKQLWSTIDAHYRRPHNFGHVPSEESLQEQFPYLDLPEPIENFKDLCGKVNAGYLRRKSEQSVNDYLQAVTTDPAAAVADLASALAQLQEQLFSETDISFSEVALDETLEDIRRIDSSDGVTGMPWPWARMNKATGGIQEGDFIMVWALPKSMKTWFGLVIAAYLLQTGRRVLVYSKEMLWKSMRRRVGCILSRTNYTKLKEGTLSAQEITNFLDGIEQVKEGGGDLIFTTADRADGSPGGPDEIRKKIETYKPHFVLLDSSYMLELPGAGANALDWRQLSVVNRRLKQICKTTKIPMLAILQENERAALKYSKSRGTASLSMNTGAVMDCDVGIRLVYNPKRQEISVHLPAARETTDPGFTIHAIAAENFDFAHDQLHAVGNDSEEHPSQDQPPPVPIIENSTSLMSEYRQGATAALDEIGSDLEEE